MRYFCLVTIATFFTLLGSAQKKIDVRFDEKSHHFGLILEDGGIVSYQFHYTNQGLEPVHISSIQTTCGCTTSQWNDSVIAPNQKGSFTVAFDPKYRPGIFNREVFVHFTDNMTEKVDTLYLLGEVTDRVRTIDERFPYSIGDLQCNCKMIYFKYIFMGTRSVEHLRCYNSSSKPQHLALTSTLNVSSSEGQTIEPGNVGSFDIIFDTNKGMYGVNMTRLRLLQNGDTIAPVINVRAEVYEDFSNMSEKQRQKAPIIQCVPSSEKHVKRSELLEMDMLVINNGLSPLILHRIEANGYFITAKADKLKIRPGKVTKIHLQIQTCDLAPGKYTRNILVISNDPSQAQLKCDFSFVIDP